MNVRRWPTQKCNIRHILAIGQKVVNSREVWWDLWAIIILEGCWVRVAADEAGLLGRGNVSFSGTVARANGNGQLTREEGVEKLPQKKNLERDSLEYSNNFFRYFHYQFPK